MVKNTTWACVLTIAGIHCGPCGRWPCKGITPQSVDSRASNSKATRQNQRALGVPSLRCSLHISEGCLLHSILNSHSHP